LPMRVIHQIDEPDPSKPVTGPLRVSASIYFRYPDSRPFDSEGMFIDGDRAILVTKTRDGREAELFAVALTPTTLLKPVQVEKIGALNHFTKPATGADLSADGRMLAVCTPGEVRLYRRDADGHWLHEGKVEGPGGQVEAIAWDGADLILANEGRELYRIAEKTWKAAVSPRSGKH
jgi:hypothetical protein